MKRVVIICLCVVLSAAAVVAVWAALKPFVLSKAAEQLRQVFPGSEVSIRDFRFSPPRRIILADVAVARKGIYDFEAGEISADLGLFSLLAGRVLRVGLADAFVNISTPQESLSDFVQYLHLTPKKGGGLRVGAVGLENVNVHVTAGDAELDAALSLEYSFARAQVDMVAVSLPSLEAGGVTIKNIFIESADRPGRMNMAVEQVAVGKGVIDGVDGIVTLEGRTVFLEFFSARTFGGRLEGSVTLNVSALPEYLAEVRLSDVAIDRIVEDFELADKFFMDGKVSGDLVLQGKGAGINVLNGSFSTALGGGNLVIKDTRFMENIAQRTNQPLDIIVESFTNYHYNTGVIGLSLAEGNILLELALGGETGKRNLTLTLHDFLSKKDGI